MMSMHGPAMGTTKIGITSPITTVANGLVGGKPVVGTQGHATRFGLLRRTPLLEKPGNFKQPSSWATSLELAKTHGLIQASGDSKEDKSKTPGRGKPEPGMGGQPISDNGPDSTGSTGVRHEISDGPHSSGSSSSNYIGWGDTGSSSGNDTLFSPLDREVLAIQSNWASTMRYWNMLATMEAEEN